jgi:hypothetical protein
MMDNPLLESATFLLGIGPQLYNALLPKLRQHYLVPRSDEDAVALSLPNDKRIYIDIKQLSEEGRVDREQRWLLLSTRKEGVIMVWPVFYEQDWQSLLAKAPIGPKPMDMVLDEALAVTIRLWTTYWKRYRRYHLEQAILDTYVDPASVFYMDDKGREAVYDQLADEYKTSSDTDLRPSDRLVSLEAPDILRINVDALYRENRIDLNRQWLLLKTKDGPSLVWKPKSEEWEQLMSMLTARYPNAIGNTANEGESDAAYARTQHRIGLVTTEEELRAKREAFAKLLTPSSKTKTLSVKRRATKPSTITHAFYIEQEQEEDVDDGIRKAQQELALILAPIYYNHHQRPCRQVQHILSFLNHRICVDLDLVENVHFRDPIKDPADLWPVAPAYLVLRDITGHTILWPVTRKEQDQMLAYGDIWTKVSPRMLPLLARYTFERVHAGKLDRPILIGDDD